VLVVLAAAGALAWSRGSRDVPASADQHAAVPTAKVHRTDLTTSLTASGTLGFGAPRVMKGLAEGTVTWLPGIGTSVSRGGQLLRVNDRPVTVMYGVTPLFRRLDTVGTVGRDVKVVAENLAAMGYAIGRQPAVGALVPQRAPSSAGAAPPGAAQPSAAPRAGPAATTGGSAGAPPPLTVRSGDAVLTESLMAAVKKWQNKAGLPQTGIVEPADVTVQPQVVRVTGVQAQVGAPASADLLTVSSTAKIVTVETSPADAASLKTGGKVTVTLPNGSPTAGTISAISPAATGGDSPKDPKMSVAVTVDDAAAIASLDAGSVQVEFTADVRKGVLAVPVGALLALSEGGYGLQQPGGRLIAVKAGLFAKGMVEVSGDGITDGMTVLTAS
jgi:hypothetical protein